MVAGLDMCPETVDQGAEAGSERRFRTVPGLQGEVAQAGRGQGQQGEALMPTFTLLGLSAR